MNAAYLVLTTAWLAGDAPAAPAPAPAAPVVSAPTGGGCGGGCGSATDSCCDTGCGKQGLFSKLKAKFHKNECGCEAAPTCCAPAPVKQHCHSAPAPTCCAPVQHQACDTCNEGCGKQKLCDRIKAKFRKHDSCGCESSCGGGSSCGCGGSGVVGGYNAAPAVAPNAEGIPTPPNPGAAPRKMPTPGTGSVMNGVPMIVTPVVAPRLSSEQPF